MKDRVFIDSNILLYTFDSKDPTKQLIAKGISLGSGSIISMQVINEVSNNLLKKLQLNNTQVKQFVDSCYKRYEVVNLTKNTFLKACDIREKYNISYYDSLIVASSLVSNCNILYSEDMQHNQVIDDLKIINPFKIG